MRLCQVLARPDFQKQDIQEAHLAVLLRLNQQTK
jgi:hypothetical protein